MKKSAIMNNNPVLRWQRYAPGLGVALLVLAGTGGAGAQTVVDISGEIPIDPTVGAGNSGRLIGTTTTLWSSKGFHVDIDLNTNTLNVNSGGGNAPFYSDGAISGTGVVTCAGAPWWSGLWNNAIEVGGSGGNTYTGITMITDGTVSLEKTSGNALCGTITVGTTGDNARVVWTANDQISDDSDVSLVYHSTAGGYAAASTHLTLNGYTDTIHNLSLQTGTFVDTGAGGVLYVSDLYLDGVQQPHVAKAPGDGFVTGSGYIDVGNSGPPVVLNPPATPATPNPADGSGPMYPPYFDGILDWADCTDATSYDVYLWLSGETKPSTPTANVGVSQYTIGSGVCVLSLTNYQWQVVAKNSVGDSPGPEWSFSTSDRTLVPGNTGIPGFVATETNSSLDYMVGIGNSGTLEGNFTPHWSGSVGSFSVPLNLNGFTLDDNTGGGNGGHVVSGPISGTGSYIITHGPWNGAWNNLYTISGSLPNTYVGPTTITRGQVLLSKDPGVDAFPGTGLITIGSDGDTARLQWGASDQINDNASITVLLPTVSLPPDTEGPVTNSVMNYLDLDGYTDTISSLILPDATGLQTQVRTGAGGVLTVTTLTVNGVVQSPGTYTSGNAAWVWGSGSVVVPSATAAPPDFPASGFTMPGGVPTFQVPTELGKTYTLFFKDNLTDPAWTALTGSGTGAGTGSPITLSDPTASLPAQRFYRLGAQ